MQQFNMQDYRNREITDRAPVARRIEKWAGLPFNLLESAGSYVLTRPMNWALRHLDGLSYRLEGTALKGIVKRMVVDRPDC